MITFVQVISPTLLIIQLYLFATYSALDFCIVRLVISVCTDVFIYYHLMSFVFNVFHKCALDLTVKFVRIRAMILKFASYSLLRLTVYCLCHRSCLGRLLTKQRNASL